MKSREEKEIICPDADQLEKELHREKYKRKYKNVFRSTVFTLITVAAVAILVATLLLPVLQIYVSSMTPTLYDGDIVISVKTGKCNTGDSIECGR